MTYISLKGNRESLTHKSEDFKKKITEYMNSKGYMLTHDSFIDGILPDLIFKRIFVEGNKETWVESKFTDLSLKNKDFLSELGKVFNAYMQRNEHQKFSYFIFVRKCVSVTTWRNIFEETKGYFDDVKTLVKSIENILNGKDLQAFRQYSFDDFIYFINDITLIEGDYADISEEVDSIIEKDNYNIDSTLLKETLNVIPRKETLVSNILKVTSLPDKIWIAELKNKTTSNFWKENRDAIVFFYKNKIYSVKIINSNSKILEYVKTGTIKEVHIDKWGDDEEIKTNILKYLIKSFVIYKGKKIGLTYYQDQNCLFFQDRKPYLSPILKHKNRTVSKRYTGFIKHDALKIDVKQIDGEFCVIFGLMLLFTKDGKDVIIGESAKRLHAKFRKNFTYNDSERSKLLHWINFFGFAIRTFYGEKEYFILSSPVNIESPFTYEGGEDFDITLLDFMKEEEKEEWLLESTI